MIGTALFAVGLSGCTLFQGDGADTARPSSSRTAFADEWIAAILDIGRFPVLPPTEDLYVGDIFALSSPPATESARTVEGFRSLATPRWKSLDVLPLLEEEYSRRPTWTPSREGALSAGDDEPENGSLYSGDRSPRRQRVVGVRALANMTIDLPDLEAYLPIEIAPLIEGPATSDRLAISMQVGEAEVYSLSVDTVLDQLVTQLGDANSTEFFLADEHRSNLSLAADPSTGLVYLFVITEVLYVRSVEVTVRNREDMEAGDVERSRRRTSSPVLDATALIPGPAVGGGEDVALAAIRRAAAMNDALYANGIEDRAGGAIKLVMATDEALTLRRTWAHPLAAALRGITLEVELSTGLVRRMASIGVPFAAPKSPEEAADSVGPR